MSNCLGMYDHSLVVVDMVAGLVFDRDNISSMTGMREASEGV